MDLKDKIKKLNNPILKDLIVVRRMHKDKEFKKIVENYEKDSLVLFHELGELHKEKNLCITRFTNDVWGFFAYWKFGLLALEFADRYGFIPIFDWSSKCLYYEDSGVDGVINPFEYYFQQPLDISIEEAEKSYNVCYFKNRDYKKLDAVTYGKTIDVERYAELVRKYYILRPTIREKIDCDINNLIGTKKTLAVQIRGVDWGNIAGHPIPPSLEKYVEEINKAIEKCDFEQIFLATDSEDTVDYISNKYPGRVVVYSDVARAPRGSKTLAIFDSSIKRENNKFLMGYEVLRDMLSLVACSGLIASYSNISFATEITKLSKGQEFEYKHIIKAKINKNGLTAREATDLEKQGKFKG